ncbi:MAG: putative endonuclease [Halanaerobium sp. 4-GBenrich]|jgi:putative endonuclease|uniref:Endonuclease n=1 Tax=Halanaerobium congolense TaxID=54121 RepID=A0A1G6LG95_9FIRM|nr:GIY-YIG nuclease family protein [Halanaerobium congolense]ODS50220.1 MAG: putative endonuclease [Halanaerobium sp. 4-GBenrich]PUU91769.1 MAG: putative endonuclease [Halanaerobium sp.]PTX15698.1 putative endonuclease [Halanaerobium congolense]TDP14190.1 putative endonuclease [Halanaerobium congolense]TDX37693.1 putative endonuclease [Halanaerobium congolense]
MEKNKEEVEVIKDNKSNNLHYIYVVECSDGSFYTGYTTDVERRLEEHNAGQGAKYTRGRLPVKLRHQESFKNRSLAQKREYEIKQLPRSKKEELLD